MFPGLSSGFEVRDATDDGRHVFPNCTHLCFQTCAKRWRLYRVFFLANRTFSQKQAQGLTDDFVFW